MAYRLVACKGSWIMEADYVAGVFCSNITEETFDELPTMAFESMLLAPWQQTCLGHPVEIPVCIGGHLFACAINTNRN